MQLCRDNKDQIYLRLIIPNKLLCINWRLRGRMWLALLERSHYMIIRYTVCLIVDIMDSWLRKSRSKLILSIAKMHLYVIDEHPL